MVELRARCYRRGKARKKIDLAALEQTGHCIDASIFQANRTQSLNYGCIVKNSQTHEVLHYVEKPSTFVSDIINCGIYLFSPEALKPLRDVFYRNQQDGQLEDSSGLWRGAGTIRLEQDVFSALAGQGQIYVHLTDGIWSQIKSAGSALYASRLYLGQYQHHQTHLSLIHI